MRTTMMKVSALAITVVLAGHGAAAAAASDKPAKAMNGNDQVAEACVEDVRNLEAEYREYEGPVGGMLRRDERILRDAALTFARNGDQEACERMIEEIRELREKHEDKAERQARVEEREKMLKDSQPLDDKDRLVWTEGLIGAEVVNMQNEDLGHVEDVVVRGGTGGEVYAMISHGGFLGLGEKLTPVRLTDLRQTEGSGTLVLKVGAERFAEAPEVDFDEEARRTARSWGNDIEAWWDKNIGADEQPASSSQ
ncbi:MAG: PRC-barrel domain-containing protein [Minwuia sp.]|uniref:PRC-barrel domain-containing protein n=1 Tax=Minwuia sp. TaxID=2493630 RepID=UPI003A8A244F